MDAFALAASQHLAAIASVTRRPPVMQHTQLSSSKQREESRSETVRSNQKASNMLSRQHSLLKLLIKSWLDCCRCNIYEIRGSRFDKLCLKTDGKVAGKQVMRLSRRNSTFDPYLQTGMSVPDSEARIICHHCHIPHNSTNYKVNS
jgi:hypothetical protein